jgi:hypothetical protein
MVYMTFGQAMYSISGKVLDAKTKEPLPFVNVYFQGSTIGTQSDLNGVFTIFIKKTGKYKLVASMIGFESHIETIVLSQDISAFQILLKEDIKALKELKVKGKRDREWERNYKEFSKDFLGSNFKKGEVFISNKEVIDFKRNSDIFTAKAYQPLIVENRKLGYRLFYILDSFEKQTTSIRYNGIPRFELLTPTDQKRMRYWEKNRNDEYLGSLKHLFKSILHLSTEDQGFNCKYIDSDRNNMAYQEFYTFGDSKKLIFNDSSLVFKTNLENVYSVNFAHRVMVRYKNNNSWVERSILKQQTPIEIDDLGNVLDPFSIELSEDMAKRRTASLLPFDYETEQDQAIDTDRLKFYLPEEIEQKLSQPRERIEINGNKEYYAAGEKIKLDFVDIDVQSGQNATFSKVLYVDLINDIQGKIIRHFKLPITESHTHLEFRTPFDLQTVNYTIRAYTQWMLNFSEKGFGEILFTVFSKNFESEIPLNLSPKLDTVIFYPEGNDTLVVGLNNRVLLKSSDNFGNPFLAKYKIFSSKNEEKFTSETDSLGLGFFEFIPDSPLPYYVEMAGRRFELPPIFNTGIRISTEYVSPTGKLRVLVQNSLPEMDTLSLVMLKNTRIIYFKKFPNNHPSLIFEIEIPLEKTQLTIFLLDKNQKIKAEKIQIIDSLSFDFMMDNRKTYTLPKSDLLKFDWNYNYENGISISGNALQKNLNPLKKTIDITVRIYDENTDTTFIKPQVFHITTKGAFSLDSLSFLGTQKVEYWCEKCTVTFESAATSPLVKPQFRPINWPYFSTKEKIVAFKTRESEAQNSFFTEIQSNSLVLKTQIKPSEEFNYILPEIIIRKVDLQTFSNLSLVKKYLNEIVCSDKKIQYFKNEEAVQESLLDYTGFKEIYQIEIYTNEAAKTKHCDCAINLKTDKTVKEAIRVEGFSIQN